MNTVCSNDTLQAVRSYVIGYTSREGRTPSYREICEGLGIRSKATVSRYMHLLFQEEEQETNIEAGGPVRRKTPKLTKGVPLQRYRLDLADGGVIWLDCAAFPSKADNGSLVFSGVFDTTLLRGSVSYIVGCRVEEA